MGAWLTDDEGRRIADDRGRLLIASGEDDLPIGTAVAIAAADAGVVRLGPSEGTTR